MTIEEIIINIRVAADGAKKGVAAAKKELEKLEVIKTRLEKGIRLHVDTAEILKLEKELSEVNKEKKYLEDSIKLTADASGVLEAKSQIEAAAKEPITIPIDFESEAQTGVPTDLPEANLLDESQYGTVSAIKIKNDALTEQYILLEHNLEMGRLTNEEEYEWQIKIRDEYAITAAEKMKADEKVFKAYIKMLNRTPKNGHCKKRPPIVE